MKTTGTLPRHGLMLTEC